MVDDYQPSLVMAADGTRVRCAAQSAVLLDPPANEARWLSPTDGVPLSLSAATVSPAKASEPGGEGAAPVIANSKRWRRPSSPPCSIPHRQAFGACVTGRGARWGL